MYQNCLVNAPKYSKLCMYRYGELTFSYSFLSVWTHKFLAKLLHIPKQAKNVEQLYCISIFNAKNLSCTVGMYIMNQKNHKKYRYVKNAQICEESKKVLLSWSIFIPLTPSPPLFSSYTQITLPDMLACKKSLRSHEKSGFSALSILRISGVQLSLIDLIKHLNSW